MTTQDILKNVGTLPSSSIFSWQCLNTFFLFQLLLNNALNFTEYRSYLNGQFLFVIRIFSEQVVKFAICCKLCNLQVVLVKLVV